MEDFLNSAGVAVILARIKDWCNHQFLTSVPNHASSATTYGVGTTANYGHVKLATGDMNGASGVNGVACGKNHTHSQYLTGITSSLIASALGYTPANASNVVTLGSEQTITGLKKLTASGIEIGDPNNNDYVYIKEDMWVGDGGDPRSLEVYGSLSAYGGADFNDGINIINGGLSIFDSGTVLTGFVMANGTVKSALTTSDVPDLSGTYAVKGGSVSQSFRADNLTLDGNIINYTSGTSISLPTIGGTMALTSDIPSPKDPDYTELKSNQEFIFRKPNTDWADSGVIKSIKGKTLVWNQAIPYVSTIDGTYGGIDIKSVGNGRYSVNGTCSDAANLWLDGYYLGTDTLFSLVSGHKYLLSCCSLFNGASLVAGSDLIGATIYTATANSNITGVRVGQVSISQSYSGIIIPLAIDLTKMYGAGKEPTLTQFNAQFPFLDGTYSVGKLLSVSADAIETVNQNIWDEQWEPGYFYNNNGSLVYSTSSTTIRSANLIPVISGTKYYCYCGNSEALPYFLALFDPNGNYLRCSGFYSDSGGFYYTPSSDVAFIKFFMESYGNIYHDDICFSPVAGEYIPHQKSVTNLNLSAIKVKSPNIWDEVWEVGSIDDSGQNETASDKIRSRNYIPIKGGHNYFVYNSFGTYVQLAYYDADKVFLGWEANVSSDNFAITPPVGCHFLRFKTNGGVTTYHNDLCINERNPAFNGRYFPHGVLTLEGGVKSVGDVYDEIRNGKYYKRIGKYTITGNETWSAWECAYLASVISPGCFDSNSSVNCNCDKLTPVTINQLIQGGVSSGCATADYALVISASDYANRANLVGMEVIYELALEEVYELAEPWWQFSYPCSANGTERFVYDSIPAIPVPCDIQYGMTKNDIAHSIVKNTNAILGINNSIRDINNSIQKISEQTVVYNITSPSEINYSSQTLRLSEWADINTDFCAGKRVVLKITLAANSVRVCEVLSSKDGGGDSYIIMNNAIWSIEQD